MIFWRIIANCFYIGNFPFAPGSFCSLLTLILCSLLPLDAIINISFILFLFFIGLYASKKVSNDLDDQDPDEIVIDEAVGMSIALFMLPKQITLYFTAFLIFRILDIFKPSIIYRVQTIQNGWGIMLDDVISGFITLALVSGIAYL